MSSNDTYTDFAWERRFHFANNESILYWSLQFSIDNALNSNGDYLSVQC